MLNMMRLDEAGTFNNRNNALQKQEAAFKELDYSEKLKDLVRWMLTIKESERPDFHELH